MDKSSPVAKPLTPAEREFSEKAIAYAEFMQKNRIYGFRLPNEAERAVEAATGEKLFMQPNPRQAELLAAWMDPKYKVFTFTGGNRGGKTFIGSCIGLSTLFGKWLWDDVRLPFKHRYPRKVRYVGQGWESHIKAVIIPALKFWWPANRPLETKKNNQGVDAIWKDLATGSTLEIMSTSQSSDVFEGWHGDLVIYDEPPPRDIRVACARGLIDRNGRELFCATLLKEAWIHREVIKARNEDGTPDLSVFNVTCQIWDNVGYGITKEGIEQFSKSLKPEERAARLDGKPSYMSTLVFPRFQREIHVKERFKIPLDACVTIQLDFHPAKKWAANFMATTRNNFKYICEEIHQHGNPKSIAEECVRIIKNKNYRIVGIQIDPLAKGDGNNDQTVYEIMDAVFSSYGYSLDVASKDKDNGMALVNDLLMTENEIPSLFFFSDCTNTIRQTEDLMYDADSLKPTAMKVEDDFTECLYRHCLMNIQWFPEKAFNVNTQPSMML